MPKKDEKINGLDNYFKISLKNRNYENLDRKIDKSMEDVDLSSYFKSRKKIKVIMMSLFMLVLITFIIIYLVMFLNGNQEASSTIISVGATTLIFIILIMWFLLKRKAKIESKKVLKKIDYFDLIQSYLQDNYPQFEVSKNNDEELFKNMIELCKNYRGSNVPLDARISYYSSGYVFQDDKNSYMPVEVQWKWIRRYKDSKGRIRTQTYYHWYYFVLTGNFKTEWKKFNFTIRDAHSLSRKGKELENDAFNKEFWYEHNDPVKIRRIFTPHVQEVFVKYFSKLKNYKSVVLQKEGDILFKVVSVPNNSFILTPNFNMSKCRNKKDVAQLIKKDIIDDQDYLLEGIALHKTLYQLF